MVPLCWTPHDHESTSTSSLCLESSDSPLMSPIFAKMSDAITKLLSYGAFPLADRSETSTGLGRWQLGHQSERHSQPLELVVRAKKELRRVIPRVAFDFF